MSLDGYGGSGQGLGRPLASAAASKILQVTIFDLFTVSMFS
jgi:hypothetical protein